MKSAESRRDVLPCLKTGFKFADLLRVYVDNNLLYKWIHVCVALCTSACVCSCRCVFRMSSASESCRPASEQFNNTLLPCCTQLRTWEQIYFKVTWGTSFFTNIRLNTNIKLLLKKQREMSPCPRGVHTTTAAVASGWSGGLGGPGPLHFESHFPACTPALQPACLQRRGNHAFCFKTGQGFVGKTDRTTRVLNIFAVF